MRLSGREHQAGVQESMHIFNYSRLRGQFTKAILLLVLVVGLPSWAVGLTAGATVLTSASTLTVGLVTTQDGLKAHATLSFQAWLGLRQAEHQLGVNPQCATAHYPKSCAVKRPSQPSSYEPALKSFAKANVGLIVTVADQLMANAVYHVAQQYPDRAFAILNGSPIDDSHQAVTLPNVTSLYMRGEQPGFIVGVMAGMMETRGNHPAISQSRGGIQALASKKLTIGALAGSQDPNVQAYTCGFKEGALSVNKNIVVYTDFDDGSFQNSANAKAIAQLQIQKHANILFQIDGQAGIGYLTAAKQAKVWAIGSEFDQDSLGPYMITSALSNYNLVVFDAISSWSKGNLTGGSFQFSLVGQVHASAFAGDTHHVSSTIVSRVKKVQANIEHGKLPATMSPTCDSNPHAAGPA